MRRERTTVCVKAAVINRVVIPSGNDGGILRGKLVDELCCGVEDAISFCDAEAPARKEVVLHVDDDEGVLVCDRCGVDWVDLGGGGVDVGHEGEVFVEKFGRSRR